MISGSRVRRASALALCSVLAAGGLMLGTADARAAGAVSTTSQPAVLQVRGTAAAPTAPPLFAYYYIWFSHSSWGRAKKDLPLIGPYSSSDPAVLRHQIQQAESAGIGGFIVSWKDTPLNDIRLQLLMKAAAQEHFKLAMIYQGLDFYRHPLPVSRVAADFITFRDRFASDPVFFRIDGKPLTIWSGTWAYSSGQVAQVTSAVRPSMLVLSTEKDVAGIDRLAGVTDGDAYYWSSVNPATNGNYQSKLNQMSQAVHREGKYWIAPLAPGFDARMVGGQKAVPRDSGQTLRTEYAAAVRSSPNMLGLISWNEFSENSYVEPSKHYGYQALDILRQLRGSAAPSPAGRNVPTGAGSSLSPWPNVLRISAFAMTLVAAVGLLSYARRHHRRRSGQRTLASRLAHGGGVGDEQRVGGYQVHPVRVVEVAGGAAGPAGVAVLPHDAVGGGVDHAHAVVEVVVDEDVAVGQRQGQRGVVETGLPPQEPALGTELDDLAEGGVVDGQVPSRVHLVGVRRIQHARRVRGP
jgi:hypothetical protein